MAWLPDGAAGSGAIHHSARWPAHGPSAWPITATASCCCPRALRPRRGIRALGGRADAVLFARRRPHFHLPDGSRAPFNSGCPIALIAYGPSNAAALRASGLGVVVEVAP